MIRISPAISLQPARWDIPFEIPQFSNATPSISCKRACAGEPAADDTSAMSAVGKLIQHPLGLQRTGRPFNPLTADVLIGGGNVGNVPSADPYFPPNALSFGGEKRTCGRGIAP